MWLTDDIAYLHMPKSGGTFTAAALRDVLGARLVCGQHDPAWLYPDHLAGRLVAGCIREPFSWYASLYLHGLNNDESNRARLAVYGGGSLDFHDVLYGFTHPWERDRIEHGYTGVIFQPSGGTAESLYDQRCGLWSWMVRYYYGSRSLCEDGSGEWLADVLLNTDRLYEAFPCVFGCSIDDRPVMNDRTTRHANTGPRSYSEWLTGDAEAWVWAADGAMMDSFGLAPMRGREAPAYWGLA